MSSVNNTNGPVDFWANLKKQKEEEARQKEQEEICGISENVG